MVNAEEPGQNGLFRQIVAVAGIGGAALVVLLFVYRDIIGASFFPKLEPKDSAILVGLIIIATFFIAVLCVYVWLVTNKNPDISRRAGFFVVLVVILLGSILGGIYLVQPPGPPRLTLLEQGKEVLAKGDNAEALKLFSADAKERPESAEPLYWKAQANIALDNYRVAIQQNEQALQKDTDYFPALAQKLVLSLVSGEEFARQEELVAKIQSVPEGKAWVDCLDENGLRGSFTTKTTVAKACPLAFEPN